MKILFLIAIFISSVFADLHSCIHYAEQSMKLQNELVLYKENNLQEEAYSTIKEALSASIKAKVECKGTIIEEKMENSIKQLKEMMDSYK